jgi:hypothetical protein
MDSGLPFPQGEFSSVAWSDSKEKFPMDVSQCALALLLLIAAGLPPALAMPQSAPGQTHKQTKAIAHIRFYDKDWATGHNFCTVAIDKVPYTSTGSFFGCTKDEARSAKLQNLPPGTKIALYDDPDCGDSDDYAVITITKYMDNIIVPGFKTEVTYSDWQIRVHYENGLMGKVSCAEVDVPGPHPSHTQTAVEPLREK